LLLQLINYNLRLLAKVLKLRNLALGSLVNLETFIDILV
jgi:hypothetical protein